MGDIIYKMEDKMPESVLRYNVLLAAYLAVAALYYCAAVQAVLFLSFGKVRHGLAKDIYKVFQTISLICNYVTNSGLAKIPDHTRFYCRLVAPAFHAEHHAQAVRA